ncbi:hypothetical protein [Mycolicibacterium fortuitum]|uniref:hypothetical protein n=1 Tax=Mycolicibacterium fortuitum TaxID=1766 RepID=UPI002608FBD1|nr:hypothetical protein [Mycolicibacterium fortuitum]
MTSTAPPHTQPVPRPGGGNNTAGGAAVLANALRTARSTTSSAAVACILGAMVVVAGCREPAQPSPAPGQAAADREQWSAAVCADGSVSTISDGQIRFPNVDNHASCMSRLPGSGGGVVPILIGEWDNEPTMRQDLAHYKTIRYTASIQHDNKLIVVASIGDTGTATLEPLTDFGFNIAPLH